MSKAVFYGWTLLGVLWLVFAFNLGFPAYGGPVINSAMAKELGFSRETLGLITTIYIIMSGLPGPVVAMAVNRFGVRRTLIAGSLMNVAGAAFMATVANSGAAAYLGFGLVVAVVATEAALRAADEAPAPGIVEVIEPARPLLTRVFATYVGPTSGLPILAPRADDIARRQLGERDRAVMKRIDGSRTLEELFDGSGLGSLDALRIVARLIRAGAVRVV